VAPGLFAKLNSIQQFATAHQAYKEMNVLLALRLNAQPIMTVPTMKNVTIQREARERNVFHCVWSLVVSLEQFVQPTITMKNVPADHLLREMVMFLALNVRMILLNYDSFYRSRTEVDLSLFFL
jgi:putative SOS response-associated peptidase YedK